MTVSLQDKITAANYNTLQSRVANILGTGSGTSGYGQALNSSTVNAQDVVTAAHMTALKQDITNGRVHQTGSVTALGDIAAQEVIGADATYERVDLTYDEVDDETDATLVGAESSKGFNDYFSEVQNLEDDRFAVDLTQASIETVDTSTRTTQWNGTITHTFTVTFDNANHRRYFFNSGGEIQFRANLSNGSGAKDNDWATMINNMGTISFNYTSTQSTGTGTGSSIGDSDVTNSFQNIFEKAGSGVYAENRYIIKARSQSNKTIDFQIEFQDNDVGEGLNPPGYTPVDENVQYISGTLTSTVLQKRATGSYVSVSTPAYTTTSEL